MSSKLIGLPATTARLNEAIFTAIGHASMCWHTPPKGIFDSRQATAVGEKLMDDIIIILHANEPNLGLATTKQLVEELHSRMVISIAFGDKWPFYKTVSEEENGN